VVELMEPSAALDGLPGVLAVTVEAGGLRQRLAFSPSHTTAASLIADVARRVAVRDLTVTEPSIEDLVRTLYAS
ncbi:MAG: methionine ABC transporter ATP-binding protein, partial [Pseudonocardiaceae bacterium]